MDLLYRGYCAKIKKEFERTIKNFLLKLLLPHQLTLSTKEDAAFLQIS